MADFLATLANFGAEWNPRNRETNRLAEARERKTRRARIETRCRIAEIQFQLDSSDRNRRALKEALALLAEYGDVC